MPAAGNVIKNVILQRQDRHYLDREEERIHFLYNATVIIADYDPERHCWVVSTVYRDPAAEAKRRGSQYREINVQQVVKTGQLPEP